jgi:putative hydrolase of the HAD superfamily
LLDVIAFDADDTLWENEILYRDAKLQFRRLLEGYAGGEDIDKRLDEVEIKNLEDYGYGIKAFTLSMLETALQITGRKLPGAAVQKIIGFGRQMLHTQLQPLPGAQEAVAHLAGTHRLMLITKGDILDQERKLAQSGLAGYFSHVEIVSSKTRAAYASILEAYRIPAQRFMMVGNSLKSDILPVVALGGWAVYIPYAMTWAHENEIDASSAGQGYDELESISALPEYIARHCENQA